MPGLPWGRDGVALSDHLTTEQTRREILRALDDLAELARAGVHGCDGASVSLLDEDSVATLAGTEQRILDLDQAQYRRGEGPCVSAMRTHEAVMVEDYRTDRRWPQLAAEAVRAGIHSSLSVSLLEEGGKTLGGLNMYGDVAGGFTAASRKSAAVFARQAALMLGYLQQLHSERAARVRQFEVAATLQRSLLPTLPALHGISCAARYVVSQEQAEVGGDWYDLFPLPDGAIGVAIGDVMGHDVAAAAAMGQLRSVLRSYAYEGSSPSLVLERLDRLVQGFDMAQVATAIFGRLVCDDRGATLLFANAGHLPPIVQAPDGRVERIDRGRSPLIGVLPPDGRARREAVVALSPGSLLLLYTDGLVETRQRDHDTGIAQLRAMLAQIDPEAGLEEICDVIIDAMGPAWEDDVALIAVRIDDVRSGH
jgi:serine phosphatase RsbU (regulator of sigma subunit)